MSQTTETLPGWLAQHYDHQSKKETDMSNMKIKPVLLAVMVATTLGGISPVYATVNSDSGIMEKTTIEPGKTISAQEENIISMAATKTLRHIAQARANIHKKDLTAAKSELDKANNLLDIIQASMPTTKVKDRIWVAKKHLEYEDSKEVIPDLVPIYSSLDELVDYMPVKNAKSHIDKARENLKKGDKQQANEELEAANADLVYTEADLPLAATRRLVAETRAELEKGNTDVADKALKNAEDNVVLLSVGIDEPLVGAKASLWEATHDYIVGSYDDAKKELKKAISHLGTAAKSSDAFVNKQAIRLLNSAEALSKKIDKGENNVGPELEQLWHRSAALSERALDYMATGWSRLRADSTVKSNLIEAKFYLNYAQVDQIADKSSKEANHDLDQALNYAAKAASELDASKRANPVLQRRVDGISTAVKKLANSSIARRDEDQYSEITEDISQVIQQL
jgi:ribosomal protein L17